MPLPIIKEKYKVLLKGDDPMEKKTKKPSVFDKMKAKMSKDPTPIDGQPISSMLPTEDFKI